MAAPALYRSSHCYPTAASSSLAQVICEVSQVLLAGGQVCFPGDLSFSPLDSAQNELNNLDGPKIPNKNNHKQYSKRFILPQYHAQFTLRFCFVLVCMLVKCTVFLV